MPGERRRLYRRVAIAAIDAVVGDVVLVAEGNGLFFDYMDVRDIPATVHRVGEGNRARRVPRTAAARLIFEMLFALRWKSWAIQISPV